MSTTQGIKLDDKTRSRLKSLAEKRDRSPHWLMRTAIEDYLQREERYEQEKSEDLQRYEYYQLTGKAIDNKKVEKWLGDLSKNKVSRWSQ
ncbi:ribbon-helix-helix protein, CopG family [Candidatus Saccharibacteria bacterium]|nr:ribbon-helix-helix protein, CopG family [Candidatus Saccharibacteria bacterium]